jgi:tRNA modification GTPase
VRWNDPAESAHYQAADAAIAAQLASLLPKRVPVIEVWNKVDAVQPQQTARAIDKDANIQKESSKSVNTTVSAKNGQGLETLRQTLLQVAGWQPAAEGVYIARERHVQALRQVSAHLDLADSQLKAKSQALDLLAEELRLAQNDLSDITGEFTSDDLLGVIFSKFCIGK